MFYTARSFLSISHNKAFPLFVYNIQRKKNLL